MKSVPAAELLPPGWVTLGNAALGPPGDPGKQSIYVWGAGQARWLVLRYDLPPGANVAEAVATAARTVEDLAKGGDPMARLADTERTYLEVVAERDALKDTLARLTQDDDYVVTSMSFWQDALSEALDLGDPRVCLEDVLTELRAQLEGKRQYRVLLEECAEVLGLNKERRDPDTGDLYTPGWTDIPERVKDILDEQVARRTDREIRTLRDEMRQRMQDLEAERDALQG